MFQASYGLSMRPLRWRILVWVRPWPIRRPPTVYLAARRPGLGGDKLDSANQRVAAGAHPGRITRRVDGGSTPSRWAGRIGRRASSPPQFGQTPCNMLSAQSRHEVHSYAGERMAPSILRVMVVDRRAGMSAVFHPN